MAGTDKMGIIGAASAAAPRRRSRPRRVNSALQNREYLPQYRLGATLNRIPKSFARAAVPLTELLSEQQLHAELNLAGCGSRRRGRDDAEISRAKRSAWLGEVRRVREVEYFSAELQPHGLADIE